MNAESCLNKIKAITLTMGGLYITTDEKMLVPSQTGGELLLCTGAPQNMGDDAKLGHIVKMSKATKIIMGGTTGKIIARELNQEITVDLKPDPSKLPPISYVKGIERVSEGVITMMAVKKFLIEFSDNNVVGKGIKYDIVRLLLSHNPIIIVEGTKDNKAHWASNLPTALERRKDLVKEIEVLLKNKYHKDVKHQYI